MTPHTAFDPPCDDQPQPHGGGRAPHRRHVKPFPGTLDVVAVVSNPVRYRSRYDLYRQFEAHALEAGARLTTVEMAYGGRPFEVTTPCNPRHVQLRSNFELWHKENLINLGLQRLPRDWRYAAWVDADIQFARHDWVQETLQQLQHHAVVQMWSHAQDLGPDHEPLDGHAHLSFAHCYLQGFDWSTAPAGPYGQYAGRPPVGRPAAHYWHPGFAWAARRESLDALGGLIDWAVLGAGDHHMAKSLIGRGNEATPPGVTPRYLERLDRWQDRAERNVKRNIGVVPGLINHYFHGPKADRRYWDRWKILTANAFDPDEHLLYDTQGLLELSDSAPIGLRDGIRKYFRQRNEDSSVA